MPRKVVRVTNRAQLLLPFEGDENRGAECWFDESAGYIRAVASQSARYMRLRQQAYEQFILNDGRRSTETIEPRFRVRPTTEAAARSAELYQRVLDAHQRARSRVFRDLERMQRTILMSQLLYGLPSMELENLNGQPVIVRRVQDSLVISGPSIQPEGSTPDREGVVDGPSSPTGRLRRDSGERGERFVDWAYFGSLDEQGSDPDPEGER